MNLPDLLSILRLVLAPAAVLVLVIDHPAGGRIVALLTAAAWLSDILDGLTARLVGSSSDRGALLDWTADKVYVLTVLVAMVQTGQAPAWVVTSIVAREIIVTEVRLYCALRGLREGVAALGKAKLGVSMAAIMALSLRVSHAEWVLFAALLLTIVSGASYVRAAARRLSVGAG